jgi:Glycosyl transferases group 1
MVMLEAHAAGLPVVAADTPAARELVREGVDGLRYDFGDPSGLIAAVRLLRGDRQLRLALSMGARSSVSGATWRHATEVLRCHYLAATGTSPGAEHRDRKQPESVRPSPAESVKPSPASAAVG